MLETLQVPTKIISLYKSFTKSHIFGVEPEVIFFIFEIVCSLSPGFILSGLYPKNFVNLSPDSVSIIGTQISSTQPGYTVDCK